jgi:hypothetical protein
MARHLTAVGILHPDTQWGVFEREDDEGNRYQLFPVSPRLKSMETANDTLFHEVSTRSQLPKWWSRLDPGYRPATPYPWQEQAPASSLVSILNLTEAYHLDNWGFDDQKTLYPTDVEVVNLCSHMDTIHAWYEAGQHK